jgi:sugar phosphate isomerase/epimerase
VTPGIVADEIDRNFAAAVNVGTALGLRRYEIRFLTTGRAPMCDEWELRETERIADGEGITITALSPGLFKHADNDAAFARDMSEVYPRAAEWAHRHKLPGLIVFGFHKPGATEQNFASLTQQAIPDQVVDWLAEAGERAEAEGLLLMIEPEPICWADSARAAVGLIGRSKARSLRINYDPGNVAWFERRDPIDEFEVAAPWIANVHVKDLLPSAPGIRPTFVPAGEGIVNYGAHFRALRHIGYTGPVSLEPHMDGRPETIHRCIDAMQRQYGKAI